MKPISVGSIGKWWCASALGCCLSLSAWAGPVIEATLTGQPLQYTKAGNLDGCGIRLIGMPSANQAHRSVDVFDASINLSNPGVGMVKGTLSRLSVQAVVDRDLSKRTIVPLTNFWLKAPGSPATNPLSGKPVPSQEPKGALIYVTSLETALSLVEAVREKKAIQVGLLPAGASIETVYFGVVTLTDPEIQQFEQCFAEWSSLLVTRRTPPGKN